MNLIIFMLAITSAVMVSSVLYTYLGRYEDRPFIFPYIAVRRYDFDEEVFKTSLLLIVVYIAVVCVYKLFTNTLMVEYSKFVLSTWLLMSIALLVGRYMWVPIGVFKDVSPFVLDKSKVVLSVTLSNMTTYQKKIIDRNRFVPKVYCKEYPDLKVECITLLDPSTGTISIHYNEPKEELPKWVELWNQ